MVGRHEDPPDFYLVHKFSPLPPTPIGARSNPAVGHSSSMSSESTEAQGKEQAISLGGAAGVATFGEHGISSLDSWDNSAVRGELSPGVRRRVGTNSDEPSGILSEADCHYLVQQNRALLEKAHSKQSRYHHR
jgi:hypothetical protein